MHFANPSTCEIIAVLDRNISKTLEENQLLRATNLPGPRIGNTYITCSITNVDVAGKFILRDRLTFWLRLRNMQREGAPVEGRSGTRHFLVGYTFAFVGAAEARYLI